MATQVEMPKLLDNTLVDVAVELGARKADQLALGERPSAREAGEQIENGMQGQR